MAKTLMVQGTMSGVGKSIITTGLLRIFRQDGYIAAPFKSQNMALNSYITKEGLEIGRAQAVQAEAAGLEPCAAMNPILLKPTTASGSQVILNGEVLSVMDAERYYEHKAELMPHIEKAFRALAESSDIIVIEGAGSPAEINLNENDIVNMGIAKRFGAPVLLVGDIDRGGVFAALIGTLALLEDGERDLIKALIVNKFRGSLERFSEGVRLLEERSLKPVAGVVPYIDIEIEDEDSLSERLSGRAGGGSIDIAAIRLPHLSNFTDMSALSLVNGVSVRYASSARELGNPDLVIVPGTKNTMADLKWMRENGLEARILRLSSEGVPIFGICGGYQMLGRELSDPLGVEEGGAMKGMGLLPISTVFEQQKARAQSEGHISITEGLLAGLSSSVYGYEIHMGVSELDAGASSLASIKRLGGNDYRPDGCQQGNVYGTYLHGVFDSEEFAGSLCSRLFSHKGLDPKDVAAVDMKAFKESQYDLLASHLREHLNMELIYSILQEATL
ncbi:MAG: cobyric acid synthase [Eubacteriaceae bacterium]|jgi:adenosylcobyric acid synthase|nr:cobyric acid synthase [Eubacteriaceae bacterium]